MKHGIKLRKLQRTPSHRWALLRNLVSALLHHESIKTTLPKAKEAARMAEKIITLGKKNTDPARRAAMAFLMPSHSYSPSAFTNSPVPPLYPTGYPSPSSPSRSASSSASSSTQRPNRSEPTLDTDETDSNFSPTSPSPSDPESFRPPTTLLPKLFTTLSTRYASRPGGYTRIHRFGRRQGDNAPHAILELVDGPRDLRFEMVARAVGRERAQSQLGTGSAPALRQGEGRAGRPVSTPEDDLRPRTQEGMQRVLRYRDEEGRAVFEQKAEEWGKMLAAEERASGGLRRTRAVAQALDRSERGRTAKPFEGRPHLAGERLAGMPIMHTGLGLARGTLGRGERMRRGAGLDRTPRFLGPGSAVEGAREML